MAIKIIDRSKLNAKTQRFVEREVSSMEKMDHPNIVCLFQVIHTHSKIYIVCDYADGGDLYTKVSDEGRFPDKKCKIFFGQMVSAIEYMVRIQALHWRSIDLIINSSSYSCYHVPKTESMFPLTVV